MVWNKAGRPKSTVAPTPVVNTDPKWRKSELRVHKDGLIALASAIVKQWKKDGAPKADEEAVKPWINLLVEHAIKMDERNAPNKLGDNDDKID